MAQDLSDRYNGREGSLDSSLPGVYASLGTW